MICPRVEQFLDRGTLLDGNVTLKPMCLFGQQHTDDARSALETAVGRNSQGPEQASGRRWPITDTITITAPYAIKSVIMNFGWALVGRAENNRNRQK